MTLKIEVTVPEDAIRDKTAATYLADAMLAIGFSRGVTLALPQAATGMDKLTMLTAGVREEPAPQHEVAAAPGEATQAQYDAIPPAEAPKRERGKPAPGKARRTKEEVAEDDAYYRQNAAPPANISTGEERVDPVNPDDAETVEQDAADEAAEVETHRDPVKPLTVDDVKSVMGKYVAKYGMPATQEDGPKVFVEALGAPPEGQPSWKVSLLAGADQATLQRVVDVWSKAVELNPLKRALVGG